MEPRYDTHPLFRTLSQALDEFRAQQPLRSKFTVALSGGADSVALLYLCAVYRQIHAIELDALYVHHGLSMNADQWQAHCAGLCQHLQIPFKAVNVSVQAAARESLEEKARQARYAVFDQHVANDGAILLGHHANDQLETVLLRIQRGAGSLGLAGMAKARPLPQGGACYRPLLSCTRQEIEAFIADFEIQHIEDESNQDERFARNFLRNRLIPLWESLQPGLLKAVTRLASIIREQEQLLTEYTRQDLELALDRNTLRLDKLKAMSEVRQRNVLRAFIAHAGLAMPSQAVLQQIQQQALYAKDDAQLAIRLGNHTVRRYRDKLYLVAPNVNVQDRSVKFGEMVSVAGNTLVVKENQLGIRKPSENEAVSVRFNCLNERIHLAHKPGSNTIKHWLKDAGIPAWERHRVPVIFYNDTPVQVVDVGFAKQFVERPGVAWRFEPLQPI